MGFYREIAFCTLNEAEAFINDNFKTHFKEKYPHIVKQINKGEKT